MKCERERSTHSFLAQELEKSEKKRWGVGVEDRTGQKGKVIKGNNERKKRESRAMHSDLMKCDSLINNMIKKCDAC